MNARSVTALSGGNVVRVGIFADVGNLYHTCIKKFNRKINYKKLLALACEGKQVTCATAYGVCGNNDKGFKKCLYDAGFKDVNFKVPKTFSDGTKKADQDGQIISDIFRNIDNFDLIILCSADGDFGPCLRLCVDKGKQAVVIGCDISHELKFVSWKEIGEDLLETTCTT